ncbi:hypothetical protein JG687_00007078 [Phytophthora cactorum]|uniref:Mitochondrial carrier domain n=1 Tax=Phytophthora cactorum TaxID=29920 RepID=A0A8T1UG64_9STRA|nr:hypothetical protein JG687_00007078 [Phytophthora cactorum]
MAALDEDWEEWTPEKGSFVNHMLAGSAAGVAEHLVAEEGTFRLFRGVSTMLGASLPAHAVYFSVFEAAKKALGADTNTITPMASGSAGVIATVCHDLIMTPMDVVKQRLQLGYYNGVADCFKTVVITLQDSVMKHEGLRALYISFPTTLLMNLPYSMIMVSANETFKKILNPSGEMNVSAYIASGAAAGALAGALTNPLDVAKTRLQTQSMMMTEEASVGTRAPSRVKAASMSPRFSKPELQLQTRGVSITVPPSCSINGRPGIERAEPVLRRQYAGLMDALIQIKAQEGFAGFFRDQYRDTLQRHFPVCVSLSWLRNRLDQPTLQRRASANLSMIQIVKDLDRDKVLLDGQLFSAANPFEEYTMESDSVSEVVKYMVKKVLTFEQETTSQYRVPGATHQPSSPAHRFANNCEARALAFVERVLQGSSRTQSGGDIYDAISFFCQQEHVSICPVSQDARPVQMRITSDIPKGSFQVEVQVCMQFKVIELTPRSPTPASPSEAEDTSVLDSTAMDSPRDSLREWAVLEGTLSRQFTLGQLSAPGTVTITCI